MKLFSLQFFCIIILSIFPANGINAQAKNVKTKIKANNVYELSVINVYPDSFPQISVIFQAKNSSGIPLWHLKREEFKVIENDIVCKVLRVINISSKKPVNIGLVLDHSGSMDYFSPSPNLTENEIKKIDFSISPFVHARNGINHFLNGMLGVCEDSVMIVAFSDSVDKVSQLTTNTELIKSFLIDIKPDGSTAFYDALYVAIDRLKGHSGIVVALTDGGDNASLHNYKEVIAFAKKNNMPVYIIGLGDIYDVEIKEIASSTGGFYYPTNDPTQLSLIYGLIKRQLKSIYQLDYISENFNVNDTTRRIKFEFLNDTLQFKNDSVFYNLPIEAQEYIIKRNKQMKEESTDSINLDWLYFVAGGTLLIGLTSFFIFRKKKRIFELVMINPNPFSGSVQVKYKIYPIKQEVDLVIYDLRGIQKQRIPIESELSVMQSDLSGLTSGFYIATLESNNEKSNSLKILKR
jgi:Ca-activated chloride channel family protein